MPLPPPDQAEDALAIWHGLVQQQAILLHTAPPYTLKVEGVGPTALVTLEANEANTQALLVDLLTQAHLDYLFDFCHAEGTVTGVWSRLAVRDILNQILALSLLRLEEHAPQGNGADPQSTLFVIRDQPQEKRHHSSSSSTTAYKEVTPVFQLAGDLLSSLLVGTGGSQAIYPSGNFAGVTIGLTPDANRIFIRGPEKEAQRALHMILKADQPAEHVLLDCYFLQLDQKFLYERGLQLSLISGKNEVGFIGNEPGPSFNPNVFLNAFIDWLFTATTNDPFVLDLARDANGRGGLLALIQNSQIRTIARQQALALNGQPASLQIGRNGYLLLTTYSAGIPSVGTQQISTGVIITLTPNILPNRDVRVTASIEYSQFSNLTGQINIAANKFKNQLSTQVQVANGHPIIMGGLSNVFDEISSNGYPGLRRVPIVNFIGESVTQSAEDQQILFILVPRIVRPALHSRFLKTGSRIPLFDEPTGIANIPDEHALSPWLGSGADHVESP